ncbi:MAG TPA: hypothetical protein VNH20_03225 [Candidatus Dormibacteraeota bacterium]|nr:hypothetical protein [Candidatus Dormibacteraeota bacterium]
MNQGDIRFSILHGRTIGRDFLVSLGSPEGVVQGVREGWNDNKHRLVSVTKPGQILTNAMPRGTAAAVP